MASDAMNENTDEHSLILLQQTLLPCYGPELPHPAEHLLFDNDGTNTYHTDEVLDRHISRLLASYSVDINHGFLPHPDPLPQLPLSSKFGCWEHIMMDLSRYLHAKNIRSVILSQLEVVHVDHDDLRDDRELQRAFFVLAMLSHAFVWGEQPISTYIPSCLAIPWVELSKRTCRPPILTHSLVVLANWKRFDPDKPIEMGNIGLLNGFLSGADEANFYLVTVELEDRGGRALRHMLRAQYFASQGQENELIGELKAIENVQKTMLVSLSKMFDEVDPYIFYNRVRHFLSGWKGNPSLPDGMLYEGVNSARQFLHGASAAQSSLIAAFDAFFHVEHNSEQTREFISEMRFYMPLKHRQFLERLGEDSYSISDLVKKLAMRNGEHEESELLRAYHACIDQLIAFRNKHIQIVALYILAQMRKTNNNMPVDTQKDNGHTVNNENDSSSARGTGGTVLMPFLKTCRDETKAQRLQ